MCLFQIMKYCDSHHEIRDFLDVDYMYALPDPHLVEYYTGSVSGYRVLRGSFEWISTTRQSCRDTTCERSHTITSERQVKLVSNALTCGNSKGGEYWMGSASLISHVRDFHISGRSSLLVVDHARLCQRLLGRNRQPLIRGTLDICLRWMPLHHIEMLFGMEV
ncbi:hypothetical protein GOP47_0005418 [Adiantum capillus-veneris]|uniref:Uncharacterized protein n=1 Tax=Adiantum capillus-veneris TaxID=13818 RepID=A0A9D4V5I2_ADICA|nr:hypothetical protein GOP47_0005418 [Adiantum capillus-veneris]